MSALHPTFEDKARREPILTDGRWQSVTIAGDRHVAPVPGTYVLVVQLRGRILEPPRSIIRVRFDRYPFDPADNGTAGHRIDWRDELDAGTWGDTWSGKVTIYPDGAYSTSVGLGIRVRGGRVAVTDRLLKFVRQRDD